MGAMTGRSGRTGASAEVIHALPQEDTYDVDLHRLLSEANVWIDALKPPAAALVEEAGTIAPDAGMDALRVAMEKVNEALRRLIEAVYERVYRQ